ncbi:MAG: DUF4384 domain-containing protein [Flavobacteriales bacterium]|nr:DUF4384 domain-containing protein [Flavobacteriales bacterium]
MTPDEGSGKSRRTPRRPGRSSQSAGGASLLPVLLGLLLKKPKLLLLVAGGFALFYFFGGMKSCGSGQADLVSQLAGLATGARFDPALYDQAEVYEPLADNVKNPLPERVTLEQYCPPRLNQGRQGSCVAWASAYAARTIVQAKATGADPRSTAFSPAYMYNQIKIENSGCQGSYIHRAMEQMSRNGALPFSKFAYTDESCSKLPNDRDVQEALPFKIKGFQRLTLGADDQRTDMLAMKQYLSQGSPIVIGMMVGGTFMQDMQGQESWRPTDSDFRMPGFGGHAMCVVGYDDYMFGDQGGFLIMNSWGPEWGKNGMAWVSYSDFDFFNKEAYAVYPMGESAEAVPDRFDLQLGFVDNADGRPIQLAQAGDGVFRSVAPVAKGTRFKVEVANNTACYIYLFGQETDGSTYVLFPYTPKHSPYCGITGTRLFPKDHSLTVDQVGERDAMAVVVSNQPYDFNKVNEALNASRASGLRARLNDVLGEELNRSVEYRGGDRLHASCRAERNALAVVLELDKR